MRSRQLACVIGLTVAFGFSMVALGQQPKGKGSEAGDKTMDKQMAWEKSVMGDDATKSADAKKIANAQKLGKEALKHPPPIQAPKVKDPNKQGVRAKGEASIGLPIESDNTPAHKKAAAKKAAPVASSDSDELGAFVATSLAQHKKDDVGAAGHPSPKNVKTEGRSGGAGKARGKSAGAPRSSLDDMFAASAK